MNTVRDNFAHYIPDEEELEQFASWAFGPYYRELDQAINFMETWNYLHSDKLKLESTGSITQDIPKMIQVWKESGDLVS